MFGLLHFGSGRGIPRQQMDEALQALCLLAGANSIFYGDKLLTTGNPDVQRDRNLLARLGLHSRQAQGV